MREWMVERREEERKRREKLVEYELDGNDPVAAEALEQGVQGTGLRKRRRTTPENVPKWNGCPRPLRCW